jgi:hypothetical protein
MRLRRLVLKRYSAREPGQGKALTRRTKTDNSKRDRLLHALRDVSTPALALDEEALDRNIAAMKAPRLPNLAIAF